MRLLKIIFALLALVSIVGGMTSCGDSGCQHAYHADAEWVITKAADCLNEGEAYNYCFKCGEKVVLPIMKTEHEFEGIVFHDATCTEGGYATNYCPICKITVTSDRTPALGHNYVDGVCTRCDAEE